MAALPPKAAGGPARGPPTAAKHNAGVDDEEEDDVVKDDDDADDSGEEQERQVLLAHSAAKRQAQFQYPQFASTTVAATTTPTTKPRSTVAHPIPSPPAKPVAVAGAVDGPSPFDGAATSSASTVPAAESAALRPTGGASAAILKAALDKVAAQKKLIDELLRAKSAAEAAAAQATERAEAAARERDDLRRRAASSEALGVEATLALGLVAAHTTAAQEALRPLNAFERACRIREALRPVCVFQVAAACGTAPPPQPPKAASTVPEDAAADDEPLDADERAELNGQIDRLETALGRSQEQCLQLQDVIARCRADLEKAERAAAQGGALASDSGANNSNGNDLASELARVQEALSESTATWDAKQQELQRLRTLMRFSVLKKESDQLQTTVQRCDELELALGQEKRKAREKHYEVERLERQLERALADRARGRVPQAELKRLRLLETHCLAIIAAQDRDFTISRTAGGGGAATSAAAGGVSGRPLSASALRVHQHVQQHLTAVTAVAGSPRLGAAPAASSVKPLRALIPPHLLRAPTIDDARNAPDVAIPSAAVVSAADSPPRRSAAHDDLPRRPPADALDAPPTTRTGGASTADGGHAKQQQQQQQQQDQPVPPSVAPAHSIALAPETSPAAAASSTAETPVKKAESGSSSSSSTKPALEPITADTPFEVIADRMAKYLEKRQDERRAKREAAEAAAHAELAAKEQQRQQQQRSRPYSAGHFNTLANLRGRSVTTTSSSTTTSAVQHQSDASLDGAIQSHDALRRQYEELKARVGGFRSSASTSSYPRGIRVSPRGFDATMPSGPSGSSKTGTTLLGGFASGQARRPLSAHYARR